MVAPLMDPISHFQIQSIALENLKLCPLCGAVNSMANAECFVCTWHGQFEHDAEAIESGLALILGQCPEILDADAAEPHEGIMHRAHSLIRRLFRRRIDIRI